jgi:hypothetical protein
MVRFCISISNFLDKLLIYPKFKSKTAKGEWHEGKGTKETGTYTKGGLP